MNTEVKVAIISALGVIVAGIAAAVFTDWFSLDPEPDPKPLIVQAQREQEAVDVAIQGDVSWAEELTDDRLVMSTMELDVEVDGQGRGTLDIERATETQDELPVTLDPGIHNYEIQGTAQFYYSDSETYSEEYSVSSVSDQDEIVVSEEDQQTFDVVIDGYDLETKEIWIKLE